MLDNLFGGVLFGAGICLGVKVFDHIEKNGPKYLAQAKAKVGEVRAKMAQRNSATETPATVQ